MQSVSDVQTNPSTSDGPAAYGSLWRHKKKD